ncbi:hypothetical protein [Sphingomonas sp. MS122]|uniref:hypothetical protein n=1 Tax=Sphingomonas sp. MS122 TaxID=3412683 RepID=UPI003C2C0EED
MDAALLMSLPLLSPDPAGEMYRLGMANDPCCGGELYIDSIMLRRSMVKPLLC